MLRRPRCGIPTTTSSTPSSAEVSITCFSAGIAASPPSTEKRFVPTNFTWINCSKPSTSVSSAKSFYEELKNDSATAAIKVENRVKQEAALKYLIHFFRDSSFTNMSKTFAINFEYGISFRSPTLFEPRTIILEQLKNSGSLRYFKNEKLQKLIGDLTVGVKNMYDRQELETHYRLQYINPIIIQHYDYDFDAAMKKDGKTIFEGVKQYEESSGIVPYHFNGTEKFDRQKNGRV